MHVVLVAPFFRPNTLQYLAALVALEGVTVSVLTCEGSGALHRAAPSLARRVRAVGAVDRSLTGTALASAAQAVAAQHGPIDRLIGILEQLQLPLGQAREALGIPGLHAQAAHNFRDKDQMKAVLGAAGLPVARHARVTSTDDAHAFAATVGFPLVLKPVAGVGARSTFRVNNDAELRSALARLRPSAATPVQAEEFVVGIERTLEAVLIDGELAWWSGTRYHPTPLQTLENDWMQYTVTLPREAGSPWTDFLPTSVAALKALGLRTGLSHMEWFETADGRWVIGEVGARPPGVNIMPLMSHAFDTDMVAAWCRLMVFGTWSVGERVRAAGSAFFRAQGAGERIVRVSGLAEAQVKVGHLVVDRELPQIGATPQDSYTGDGWAVVAAPTTAEVTHALGTLVQTVRVVRG